MEKSALSVFHKAHSFSALCQNSVSVEDKVEKSSLWLMYSFYEKEHIMFLTLSFDLLF